MNNILRTAFAAALISGTAALAAPAFAAPDNVASPPPASTNNTSAAHANAGMGSPSNNVALTDTTTGGTTVEDNSNIQASNNTALRHPDPAVAAEHAQVQAATGNAKSPAE